MVEAELETKGNFASKEFHSCVLPGGIEGELMNCDITIGKHTCTHSHTRSVNESGIRNVLLFTILLLKDYAIS